MTKTIEKLMLNGVAYNTAYDKKITIKKNGTKVDDFTLNQSTDKDINITVPTNSDYVDLTTAQSVGGVKTFTSAPVVPSKTTDATNTGTAVATEAQVYKKQDALTLPATPTSGHLVTWGANNKTLADGGAVPTGFEPGTGTTGQILRKTASGYEWSDEVGQVYTAGTNIDITNNVISATDTTYSEVSKSDMDTGTGTTAGVVSAKSIADYVSGRVASTYRYKGTKANYDALPTTGNVVGDVWNVEAAHTTAPKFPAGSNLAWDGTGWDVLGGIFDTSSFVDLSSNQTIGGTKTFSTSPVVPSKTTDAANTGTAVATEAQVYKKQDKLTAGTNITISNNTISAAGDMAYSDFDWVTKTGATITMDVRSTITPTGSFTVNAPSTIKEGQEYVLRVSNGATAYTMSLGTNITNPFSQDLTLNANAIDQFLFLGVDGKLELVPEVATASNVVMLTGDQTIAGTKTFSTSPVVPSKTSDATNTGTAIATEAQVYKKQDALTLPSSVTSGNAVVFGSNKKTLQDAGGAPVLTSGNQTIAGTKTFSTSPVVPSKTSAAGNTGTAVATEAQVYLKQDTLIAGTNIQIANDGKTISATDTTYESKTAASGGTDVSLVTTGEKYTWNNKANTSDIKNTTISFTQGGNSIGSFTTNQASASTLAFHDNIPVTQSAYDTLPSSKTTDGNTYLIYSSDEA